MRILMRTALAGVALATTAATVTSVSPATADTGQLPQDGFAVSGQTVTFPIHQGRTTSGASFWYIVIEASDSATADRFGVRVVNKLRNATGTPGAQRGQLKDGVLVTPGSVDFAPQRRVAGTPGTGFPPITATPGSVGDANYSPVVQLGGGGVINAPVVANATGQHDKVVSLSTSAQTVTLQLTDGFARSNAVQYLSTDATAPDVAALEGATFAPKLAGAPRAGDDSTGSARAGLAAFVNGPTGGDNPQRQGLNSALLGEGDPLNVLAWLPSQGRYSSLWDVHLTQWAPSQSPRRVTQFADVQDLADSGVVTGPGGSAWRANDIIVNCPILAFD